MNTNTSYKPVAYFAIVLLVTWCAWFLAARIGTCFLFLVAIIVVIADRRLFFAPALPAAGQCAAA